MKQKGEHIVILKKPTFILVILSLVFTLVLAFPQSALADPPQVPCPTGSTTLAKYDWGDGVWVFSTWQGEGADVIDFLAGYQRNFGSWQADPGVIVSVIVITDGNANQGTPKIVDWGYDWITPPSGGPDTYNHNVMLPNPDKDISNMLFCGSTVPITLAYFNGNANRGTVTIDWVTATEINTAGFLLYRSTSADGPQVQLTENLIAAKGNEVTGSSYRLTDTPGYGTYYYWLRDTDYSGQSSLHGPVAVIVRPAIRLPVYRPSLPGQ